MCTLLRTMRSIRFFFLMIIFTGALEAGEWTLIKHQGRDYVSLNNVAEFYKFGAPVRINKDITLQATTRRLKGEVGSSEFLINNLKFILSYPLVEQDGKVMISRMDLTKLIDPVLRPGRIQNTDKIETIVLDAGHGGHDQGATSVWGNEKAFTLDVVSRLKAMLLQQGFKVHLTRSSDVFIPLEERVRQANNFKNALFISVHFNSGGSNASGLETYTLAPLGVPSMAADGPRLSDLRQCPGHVRDAENMALATATHAAMVSKSHMYDRGIKRARFVVIRDITIPGVLIEGGFLSNSNDSRKIASTGYRQQMAGCILQAIQTYCKAVGPKNDPGLVAGQPAIPGTETAKADQSVPNTNFNEPRVITPTTN